MNALESILAYKRDEVAALRRARSAASLEGDAQAATPPRGFRAALAAAAAAGRVGLIAEVKKASPSRGVIRTDFDPEAIARAYAAGGATCLSVLPDAPSFKGAPQYLTLARGVCALPVLRKDFLIDPIQVVEARALGADAVLIILAAVDDALAADLAAESLRLGMDALVEVHDVAEMQRAARLGADLIGINNRDLTRFEVDLGATGTLARLAPGAALLVSESGISTASDIAEVVAAGASAVLVGESLMRRPDVERATRDLLAGGGSA